MAITINSVPTLKESAAKRFIAKAKNNAKNERDKVDFSKQVKSAKIILKKFERNK
ncbi:MAG: hypothetical protein WD048_10050 [Chitinophagales bacterium]